MSIINPEVHKDKDEDITDEPIVKLFEIYVENEYSSSFWKKFRSREDIEKVYSDYYEIFGDSIFQILVDTLAVQKNIPIKDILADFGQFIQTYY